VITFKMQPGGVPSGTYRAKFCGVEPSQHAEYGPGVRFLFEVTDGPYAGQQTGRVTALKPTPGNNTGRMLAGIVGRPLRPDEEVDIDQYVGRPYLLTVEQTPGGATRVATVVPSSPS
jgi:hypothetical protein